MIKLIADKKEREIPDPSIIREVQMRASEVTGIDEAKLSAAGNVYEIIKVLCDYAAELISPVKETIFIESRPSGPDPEEEGDEDFKKILDILEKRKLLILEGPPGVQKTYYALWAAFKVAGPGRYTFVQFNPAYTYDDFIEMKTFVTKNGAIAIEVRPRLFKILCDIAKHDENHRYAIVIDEINRAVDIYAVFGELLFCLEYRGHEVILPYSGERFSVPGNVYIIATMNSLERGATEVGMALRRRFAFYNLKPDERKLSRILERNRVSEELKERCITLFKRVNEELRESLGGIEILGHLFFKDVRSESDLKETWEYFIKPLIRAYAPGEATRIIESVEGELI